MEKGYFQQYYELHLNYHLQKKEAFLHQPKPHSLHENELKIHHIYKCKLWKYKTFRKTHERKSWPEIIQRFLINDIKNAIHKRKKKRKNWSSSKLKLCSVKNTITKNKKTSNKLEENICKSHLLQWITSWIYDNKFSKH